MNEPTAWQRRRWTTLGVAALAASVTAPLIVAAIAVSGAAALNTLTHAETAPGASAWDSAAIGLGGVLEATRRATMTEHRTRTAWRVTAGTAISGATLIAAGALLALKPRHGHHRPETPTAGTRGNRIRTAIGPRATRRRHRHHTAAADTQGAPMPTEWVLITMLCVIVYVFWRQYSEAITMKTTNVGGDSGTRIQTLIEAGEDRGELHRDSWTTGSAPTRRCSTTGRSRTPSSARSRSTPSW